MAQADDDEKAALHELYPNGDASASQPISFQAVKPPHVSRPSSAPDPAGSPRRPSHSLSQSFRGSRLNPVRRHSKSHMLSSPKDSSQASSSSPRLSRLPSKNYRTYPPLHSSISSATSSSSTSKLTPSGAMHTPNSSLDSSAPSSSLHTPSLSPANVLSSSSKPAGRLSSRDDEKSTNNDPSKHKRLDSNTQLSIIYNGIRFRAIPIQSSNKPPVSSIPSSHAPTTSSSSMPRKQKRRSQNKSRAYQVSSPSNVQHVMHVEWNEDLQAYTV